MTFPVQVPQVTYNGNGATVNWAFTFEIPFQTDGVTPASNVFSTLANVQTPLVLNTDYTISGVGVEAGGLVTTIGTSSPVPMGTTITIQRDVAINQETSFPNQGFLPSDIESQMDRMTMIMQDLSMRITNLEAG